MCGGTGGIESEELAIRVAYFVVLSQTVDAEYREGLTSRTAGTLQPSTAGAAWFPSHYVREAILAHLEEIEDLDLAEGALERVRSGKERTVPLKPVMKRHGLQR
jgi:predicted DNA-binding protein